MNNPHKRDFEIIKSVLGKLEPDDSKALMAAVVRSFSAAVIRDMRNELATYFELLLKATGVYPEEP